MIKALELCGSRIKDSTLINELCNLTIRNGRVDHKEGRHDDTVIGLLLSSYLVLSGKNLGYYGISNKIILSSVSPHGEKINKETKDFQLELRKRISELENKLGDRNLNYIIRQSYLRELNSLRPLVDNNIIESVPIAESQLAEERREIKQMSNNDYNTLQNFSERITDYYKRGSHSNFFSEYDKHFK